MVLNTPLLALKEMENSNKKKKEEMKETKEDEKNKVNIDIPPEKPLFQTNIFTKCL